MSDSRTIPENWIQSWPWLSNKRFSPRTSAVPLARTSAMVTATSPLSVLVCVAVPSPLNDELLAALRELGLRNESTPVAGGVIEAEPPRWVLEPAALDEAIASTSTIVTGSPTWWARCPA